jgi:hypothetical protein
MLLQIEERLRGGMRHILIFQRDFISFWPYEGHFDY